MRLATLTLVPLLLLLPSCAVVPEDATPQVALGAAVADKFIHRGMPQNRNWVAQGHADITLPGHHDDSITVSGFGNVNLRDSTGSAWLPDGHDGRFSVLEFTATYARSFDDVLGMPLEVATGLQNYALPQGPSFPFGPRSETNELFLHLATEVLGATPEVQLRYDFDQGEGFYGRAGLREDFPIVADLTLELAGHLAYSSAGQSFWNYGLHEGGLADLQGSATLLYQYDTHTELGTSVSASTIVDSTLSEWFDTLGLPENNLWVSMFVEWRY